MVLVASLDREIASAAAASAAFATVAERLSAEQPGYSVDWLSDCCHLSASPRWRLCLVHDQSRSATIRVHRGENLVEHADDVRLGDATWLSPGTTASMASPLDVLVFEVPAGPDENCPVFLRPDVDPRLTDTPGGCATAGDAYRRVMLTWLASNGPYTARSINCHRVRMTDSFSHYHPREGGFEEIYLVHEVAPGARILWSREIARIEERDAIDPDTAHALLNCLVPRAGDLVFIPRGTMHRAIGGVLAHVVTIPGFMPAREIGVDHHLRAISESLGLSGDDALPYHVEASMAPLVK